MVFNAIGGLVGGALGFFGNRSAAKRQDRATQQALEQSRLGFDFLRDSPVGQNFLPGGAEAFDQRQALLGLGGDPTQARQAFDNFLNSSGFQFALDSGSDAITGSRAARGLLNSGRTGAALTEFGSNLGRQSFDNFLGQLGQQANFGLQAGSLIGSAGSGAGTVGAQAIQTGAQGAGQSNLNALNALSSGFGAAVPFLESRFPGLGGRRG